jgi:predicted glycosyltransferase involved in capsule biosynthesis
MYDLSLIVTYRARETHLRTQIAWWKKQVDKEIFSLCEVIIVEVDESPSAWIKSEIFGINFKYIFLEKGGAFHKTKALNLGLSKSQGKFVVPFDVDLIPIKDTLFKHLQMAQLSAKLLMTGYRVMSELETIDDISTVLENTAVAPEDKPTALWKHLIRQERFGVLPFFERQRLLEINGWDERFIGWGGEDQDIIERYLADGRYLCRSPELVYLHLSHPPTKEWNDEFLVEANRKYYYAKMQARSNMDLE